MDATDQAVRIVRVINTSPDRLFAAWTDPERRKQWMIPPTYRLSVCTSDPVVGGEWVLSLFDEVGAEHRDRGVYATLAKEMLIETSWFYSTSERPGEDESWLSVTFREIEPGRTEQTLVHSRLETGEQRQGYGKGWAENMDRLDALMSS